MSWTEDRVEILKTLWVKGLSASQIAIELGGGVTRNAVIGKVHRLKLAARAKPATSSARTRSAKKPSKRVTRRTTSSNKYSTTKTRSMPSAKTVGATALKQSPSSESEIKIAHNEASEVVIPIDERISLLELRENNCKWPIGDPMHPDFHFCGKTSLEGKPYCETHSKRAYHKMERKKR